MTVHYLKCGIRFLSLTFQHGCKLTTNYLSQVNTGHLSFFTISLLVQHYKIVVVLLFFYSVLRVDVFMPLVINVIHYNSSFLDEDIVSGIVRLVLSTLICEGYYPGIITC